jgi:TonB-dependent receptor
MLLTSKLRFIGGARYEMTDMEIRNEFNPDNNGELSTDDVLSSVNFVYEIKPDMNLRAAYGRTLARPTLREMAPYGAFEFVGGFILTGNPDLKRTLIDNYDVRWEFFPRPGEIYAFSVYAKKFTDPIETAIINENEEVQYQNVDEARVYGIELELRKGLDQIHESLAGFSTGGNVSFVRSYVDIPEEELLLIRAYDSDASDTREFQGQSPFLLNLNVNYDNTAHDIHTGLFYNVFGERLSQIALPGTPNIYEKPRHMLNFSLSKSLTERIDLSFSAKNILNSAVKEIQDFKGVEYISTEYTSGRSFSIGLKYSL